MTTTSNKSLKDKFILAVGYTINGIGGAVRSVVRPVFNAVAKGVKKLGDINPLLVVLPPALAMFSIMPAIGVGAAVAETGMGALGIMAGIVGGAAVAGFAIAAVAEVAKRGVQFLSKASQTAQKDKQQKQALKKN